MTERTLEAAPNDVRLTIAPQRLDPRDRALRYKTTRRRLHDEAYAYALRDGSFEAVLLGAENFVADGSRTTIFVTKRGAVCYISPRHSRTVRWRAFYERSYSLTEAQWSIR